MPGHLPLYIYVICVLGVLVLWLWVVLWVVCGWVVGFCVVVFCLFFCFGLVGGVWCLVGVFLGVVALGIPPSIEAALAL